MCYVFGLNVYILDGLLISLWVFILNVTSIDARANFWLAKGYWIWRVKYWPFYEYFQFDCNLLFIETTYLNNIMRILGLAFIYWRLAYTAKAVVPYSKTGKDVSSKLSFKLLSILSYASFQSFHSVPSYFITFYNSKLLATAWSLWSRCRFIWKIFAWI